MEENWEVLGSGDNRQRGWEVQVKVKCKREGGLEGARLGSQTLTLKSPKEVKKIKILSTQKTFNQE